MTFTQKKRIPLRRDFSNIFYTLVRFTIVKVATGGNQDYPTWGAGNQIYPTRGWESGLPPPDQLLRISLK